MPGYKSNQYGAPTQFEGVNTPPAHGRKIQGKRVQLPRISGVAKDKKSTGLQNPAEIRKKAYDKALVDLSMSLLLDGQLPSGGIIG